MDGDEWFRQAYRVKGWNIVILTNERLIILDTNLQTLSELGQLITGFDEYLYSWNAITLTHKASEQ